MIFNLNDPESILRWWKVFPARHDPFLEFSLKTSPEFAPAIREVQRRIAASPELRAMLSDSVRVWREQQAAHALRDSSRSAHELRLAEFA